MRNALLASLIAAAFHVSAADDPVRLGRRLYEEGILANGEPVRAVRPGQAEAGTGAALACAQCHRRSGMGGREGEIAIPRLTGPHLFSQPQPQRMARKGRQPRPVLPLRQDSRVAYDDASLARAVREGVDASGRSLMAPMPRYALGDADMANLVAYLRQLGAAPVPGAAPDSLRLATVITPDADPERRRTVAAALAAWSERGGLSHLALPVDIWELEGEAATWGAQLRSRYRSRPVFAILSGAGGAEWRPVAEFCEEQALPCVFPLVDNAPETAGAYYNVYLDAGLPLEARLLAAALGREGNWAGRLVHLVADAAGAEAARRVGAMRPERHHVVRRWDPVQAASLLADLHPDDVLVAWLRPAALEELFARLPLPPAQLYVSARLAPPDKLVVPAVLKPRLRWVSTRIEPRRLRAHAAVWLRPWTEQLQLGDGDGAVQAEVYAATYFFADALARMRRQWSREYLLESLEAGMYNRPAANLFHGLSLGPGQRVAAKAGRILGLLPPGFDAVVPLGPRLVP